jgi:hypothetical protein
MTLVFNASHSSRDSTHHYTPTHTHNHNHTHPLIRISCIATVCNAKACACAVHSTHPNENCWHVDITGIKKSSQSQLLISTSSPAPSTPRVAPAAATGRSGVRVGLDGRSGSFGSCSFTDCGAFNFCPGKSWRPRSELAGSKGPQHNRDSGWDGGRGGGGAKNSSILK